MSLATVILAAGLGTRMKSDRAKVLHAVAGRPMIYYPVALARGAGAERTVCVLGHQAEVVLLRPETIARLVAAAGPETLALATAVPANPKGLGRIVREGANVKKIVE